MAKNTMNNDLDARLREAVENIEDSYYDLVHFICVKGRKTGKQQEILDYINKCRPDSSRLILFIGEIDRNWPQPAEDMRPYIYGEFLGEYIDTASGETKIK